MRTVVIAAVAGALTLGGTKAFAQCAGWLPNVALPTELNGTITTFSSSLIGFDFDGPGPEPESLVIAGILGRTVPDGNSLQRFDGRRWIGMGPWNTSMLFVFDDDDSGPNLPRLHRASGSFIARLTGENWELLSPTQFFAPDGIPDVRTAVSYDADGDGPLVPVLVLGGRFAGAGSITSPNVIAWEGSDWFPLGGGIPGINGGTVQDLCVFDPDGPGPRTPLLIAGGSIIDDNCKVAAWDGASWTCIGTAATAAIVNALDLFDRDGNGPLPPVLVAAGGRFTSINGVAANNIAYYDGQTWHPIGQGLPTAPSSMTVFDPDGDGPRQQLIFASQFAAPMRVFDGQTWSDAVGSPHSASQMTMLRNARFSNTPQLVVGGPLSQRPLTRFALSNSAPQILTQPPTRLIIRLSVPAALTVAATGDELTFRWFRNSRPFDEGVVSAGVRSGVFGPTLRFEVPAVEHSGTYYVEVGNACGVVRSQHVEVVVACVSDFNANLSVDFFDYLDFVAAFDMQRPDTDIDNNGQVDFLDYLEFVEAFSNGC
jgi:hypothetical protein